MKDFINKYWILILVVIAVVIVGGCSADNDENRSQVKEKNNNKKEQLSKIPTQLKNKRKEIINKYKGKTPKEWGEDVPGVITRIDTDKKVVVLTLDACGGENGNGYDSELIDFLKQEKIPAVLFVNYRWIEANPGVFKELSNDPLFTIGNHGYRHLPLSVNGKSVYGIKGTADVEEVVEEVLGNHWKIKQLTGEAPDYFRSGTAYYDELAVEIVNDLGEKVIGYDILGDAGATFTKKEVKKACLNVSPGSIILAHMNHPESETAEGIMAAVPKLREKGFKFVKLDDYDEELISEKE